MPTISQLPAAISIDPADELMLDRLGQSVSVTTGLLLGGTQPRLTLAPGVLLGRVSTGSGGPEPVVLGSGLALQAGTLQISGSLASDTDLSSATVLSIGGSISRTLAARAADHLNVLDFGADPSGVADSTAAFVAAIAAVPANALGRVVVPSGSYLLTSTIVPPRGRSVAFMFEDGASLTGAGSLAVQRIESQQGAFRLSQVAGTFSTFPTNVGSLANVAFSTEIVQNTAANSGSARVGWSRSYTNQNRFSKYSGGSDVGVQRLLAWPRLLDGTPLQGHSDVFTSPTYDEDSALRAQVAANAEHSEFDVVNNGPDFGWSAQQGSGTPVQGMSIVPWAQSGRYGGHLLFAYGTAGSYDGASGGINQRWVSYPAVYSIGNPAVLPQVSTLTFSLDLSAKGTASLGSGGVVAGVTITAGGGAYTSSPVPVFSGGGGSGASGTATLLGGAVVAVTIVNPGAGYTSPPGVTFTGGGVSPVVTTSLTLNADGLHGDLASVAAAIRGTATPMISAAVVTWGGTVSRLVVFGTAPNDLGILTLGGSALATLGITGQSYVAPRDDTAIAFGTTASMGLGDRFTINGSTVTVGGLGAPADIAAAVNRLALSGLAADVTAGGRLVLTAWLPQQPCGLVLSQPAGSTALSKVGLAPGILLPPTPPKAFATALGEMGSGRCKVTDAIQITATDLAGTVYGPVGVTLSGGTASGSISDVVVSIKTALQAAGWYSSGLATLTAGSSIVAVFSRGTAGTAGLVIRNTAGGILTLANAVGAPLDTLGLTAGTYRPGGYSAGSQTVFYAAPNSLAPQGRGVFVGGSSVSDRTVWPHTPMEVRGSFTHGFRTDGASFADGNALLLAAGQCIGWGVGGPSLTVANGTLNCSAPASLPALLLTALATSPTGLPAGAVWNNGGVLSIV